MHRSQDQRLRKHFQASNSSIMGTVQNRVIAVPFLNGISPGPESCLLLRKADGAPPVGVWLGPSRIKHDVYVCFLHPQHQFLAFPWIPFFCHHAFK
jgi:hypothetical protein